MCKRFRSWDDPGGICDRYREGLTAGGDTEGHEREMVGQARTAFGLGDKDLVLGQHKVGMLSVS